MWFLGFDEEITMKIQLNGVSLDDLSKVTTLFLDIDGTLLDRDHNMPKRVRDSLLCLKKYYTIILCTGRYFEGTLPVHKDLGLNSYMVCLNGGCVYNEKMQHVRRVDLSTDAKQKVLDLYRKHPCVLNTYPDFGWYVTHRDNHYSDYEVSILHTEPTVIKEDTEIRDLSTTKFLFLGEKPKLDALQEELEKELSHLTLVRIKDHYLEIYDKEADKGCGIRFVMDKLGVTKEECLSMGDAKNDIAMFRETGIKVEMGNSDPELREFSNVSTTPNTDCGAAEVFELLLSLKQNCK